MITTHIKIIQTHIKRNKQTKIYNLNSTTHFSLFHTFLSGSGYSICLFHFSSIEPLVFPNTSKIAIMSFRYSAAGGAINEI